jgi:hypothetical protein
MAGEGNRSMAEIMAAEARDARGTFNAVKNNTSSPSEQDKMSRMTTLRWSARPNKKCTDPSPALSDFVQKDKKQKKKKKGVDAEVAAAVAGNPWDMLSMAVAHSPATLNDIMLEQKPKTLTDKASSAATNSRAAAAAPVSTRGTCSTSRATTKAMAEACVNTSESTGSRVLRGAWSLAGWKAPEEKIQGEP